VPKIRGIGPNIWDLWFDSCPVIPGQQRKSDPKEIIEKTILQIKAKELTKDYNLGTSLKSYVDPRVYLEWGKKVDYNWRNYYSKTLEKKFSWIDPLPSGHEIQ